MYFFLLILGILLNFSLDAGYKCGRYSETLPKKDLKFDLSRGNDIVIFNSSFMLLPIEINLITEEQDYKNDMCITCDINCVKIIFILPTKIIALYI